MNYVQENNQYSKSSICDLLNVQIIFLKVTLVLCLFFAFTSTTHATVEFFTTTGTSTWVAPANVTSVTVEVWGAGGGSGGGSVSSGPGGSGGGGGSYAQKVISVTPGNSYTYSVGAGGVAAGGASGGNSRFVGDSSVEARACGGTSGASNAGAVGTSSPISCNDGTTIYLGGAGAVGAGTSGGGGGEAATSTATGTAAIGTAGGTGQGGTDGSAGQLVNVNGVAGANPSAGAGGSGGRSGGTKTGAAGGVGQVKLTYTANPNVFSGTLYSDEGTTAITSSKTIVMAVGTTTTSIYSTTTDSGVGTWHIDIPFGHTIGTSTPILVWVDATSSVRAALFTKASTTRSITGLNLYQNRVIISHEGTSGTSTTNTNMSFYDGDNDSDIQFTSNSGTLTVNTGNELHIQTGKTYAPGGNVTINANASTASTTDGSFHMPASAIYTAGGMTTIGGNLTASSSVTFTTHTSGTLFTATTTGKTVLAPFTTLGSTTFNGSGGAWTMSTTSTTTNLTITNGTLTAPATTLTVTGSYANAGTFTNNGGTTIFASSSVATITYTGTSFDTAVSNNADPSGITAYNGFFWITDDVDDEVYKYSTDGTYVTSFDTAASGNTDPRGVTAHDGFLWVTDRTADEVYKYTTEGTYATSFDTAASGNTDPVGITAYNGFFWIVDSATKVYKYSADGTYTGISFNTSSCLSGSLTDITAYNEHLYTLCDGLVDNNAVVKYTTAGIYVATSTSPASPVSDPVGITQYGGNFWIIDYLDDEVYKYTADQSISGNMTGSSAFNNLTFSGSGGKDFGTSSASTTNFTIEASSGVVTAPYTNLSISGNFSNATTSGFNANSATTSFNGTSAQDISGTIAGTSSLRHVVFSGAGSKTFSNNASTTNFIIDSTSGAVVAPTSLTIGGNYSNSGSFTDSSGTVYFASTTAQTIAGTMNTSATDFASVQFLAGTKTFSNAASTTNFTINTGATVVAPTVLSISGNYTNSGTFTHNSGTTTLNGSAQQTLSGTLTGTSAFNNLHITNTSQTGSTTQSIIFASVASTTDTLTMNASTSAQFLASATSTFQNIALNGAVGQYVTLRSSTGNTQYNFYVPGTQKAVTYVDVRDANSCGSTIDADDGTNIDSGNNTCWTFIVVGPTLTFSGTLYSDEGITPITSMESITIAVGTSTPSIHSLTSDGSGNWTIDIDDIDTIGTSTPILVFVDNEPTIRAALFTKASNTLSIGNLNLYQNRVIVSHEGTSGTSTTNSDMSFYDGDNDSDIQYTSNSGALTVNTGNELHIQTGKTYAPGGAVTINANASTASTTDGSFHLMTSSTYTAGGLTTIGGNLTASSSATYTTHTSGTLFTATTTGKTVLAPFTTMGSTTFNGSGGAWTMSTTSTTTNLTITNGTLTAPATTLAVTGSYLNSGSFTHNSGTVTFASSSATTTYTGVSFAVYGGYGITSYNGFLWVLESLNTIVYQYTPDGVDTGVSFDVHVPGAKDLVAYNGFFWVTDSVGDEVYKYTLDGTYTGTSFDTAGSGNGDPYGITAYDGYLWIVDATDYEVYQYTATGTYTGVHFDTAASGNTFPTGITTYNGFFWIVNPGQDLIYQYTTTGTHVASFDTAASGNGDPYGIAAYNGSFWTGDYNDNLVYKYTAGQGITGNLTGTSAFNNLTFTGAAAKDFGTSTASTTNLTIEASSGVVTAPYTNLSVSGNFSNATTSGFNANQATTTFSGASAQDISGTLTGTNTFSHVAFTGAGTKTFSNNASTTNVTIDTGATVVAPTTLTIGGNYSNSGSFTDNSGTVFFSSTATQTIAGTMNTSATDFNSVQFSGASTKTFSNNASTTNFTINTGATVVAPTSLTIGGNYSNSGSFTDNAGTVHFSSTTAQTIAGTMNTSATDFNSVQFSGASTKTFSNNASTTNLTIDTGATVVAPTALTITGNYSNSGSFTDNSGTVYFSSTTAQTIAGTMNTSATDFGSVQFLGASTKTFSNSASTTNFTIDTGATVVASTALTIGGNYSNSGSFTDNSSTVFFSSGSAQTIAGTLNTSATDFASVQFLGAGTKTFSNNASTTNFTIDSTSGAVTAPSLLSISGNYANAGTFTHNSGTTTLNGSAQQTLSGTLVGTSAFNNLHITNTSQTGSTTQSIVFASSASTTDTLTMNASTSARFLASATSTFQNISFGGEAGRFVWLRSSVEDTPWNLVVPGTQKNVVYVNVKDSHACSGNPDISAVDGTSVDAGGNTCWDFPAVGESATISSASNQTFVYGDATTTMSVVTVTDDATTATITAVNDLRIVIATTTVGMLWDTTDTTATFGGTASGKVSNPVSYEGDGSVLVIPVDTNFAVGDTLTISGLSYAQFTDVVVATSALRIRVDGADGSLVSSDDKTVEIQGNFTLADHSAGQAEDNFATESDNDIPLFAFRLTPNGENISVNTLTFTLSDITAIRQADIFDLTLYRDVNSDGAYDVGDTAVGGSGVISIVKRAGTIIFSTPFSVTAENDYILVGDTNSMHGGDRVTISLSVNSIEAEGVVTSAVMVGDGSTDSLEHTRRGQSGGGGRGEIGGNAPAGDGDVSGGGGDGGNNEIDPDTGTGLSNRAEFNAPTSSGSPNDEWTSGSNGYNSDGSYATTGADTSAQSYGSFSFTIPSNNEITGIAVEVEASASTNAGTISIQLSWDGGASFTTVQTSDTLTTTDGVYTFGGASDTWGRVWVPSESGDGMFVVDIVANTSGNTVRVDALQARFYNQSTGGGGGGGAGGEI